MADFSSHDADERNLLEVEEAELSSEDDIHDSSPRPAEPGYAVTGNPSDDSSDPGRNAIISEGDPGEPIGHSGGEKSFGNGLASSEVKYGSGAAEQGTGNYSDDSGEGAPHDENSEREGDDIAERDDAIPGDDEDNNASDGVMDEVESSDAPGCASDVGEDGVDRYRIEDDAEDRGSSEGDDFDADVGAEEEDVDNGNSSAEGDDEIMDDFSGGEGDEEVANDGVDDDDASVDDIRVRRPRQRRAVLKIPEDMRDDGKYFRRSSRQRRTVSRFTLDDDVEDSSEVPAEQDSDFDAGENESDDEDEDDPDGDASDEGYVPGSRRRAKASKRRPRVKMAVDEEDVAVDEARDSTSGSDGDWNSGPSKRRAGGRRSRTKRRPRVSSRSSEDDDVAQTMRINARTGGAVNYAEAEDDDSDILDEEDAAAARAAKLEAAATDADDGVDRIEHVCDYRMPSGEGSPGQISRQTSRDGQTNVPFVDFDPDVAEFNIHWARKSYRSNTWHRQEELKLVKGFRKVTTYVARVLERAAELQQPSVSSEELEEAGLVFIENREALQEFTIVDRVVAERDSQTSEDGGTEFLVKWRNLAYEDCTWELTAALTSEEDVKAIDAFRDRVQLEIEASKSSGKAKRFNPFGKEPRGKFRRMASQPKYLHGEGRTLREYQLAGLNWLAFSWSNNRNVILADEMGLGKTLQTISFLGWVMYQRSVPGPFLVVVPLSTIAAWVREFARWLPEMNVICYTGTPKSREMIREYEFQPRCGRSRGTGVGFHTLLTTPELAMLDLQHLLPTRWAMIAVDEAHRLKNKDSELHTSLLSLSSANRLLVTGTPLQNSVRELWALLHFLNPEQFDSADEFEESFSFSALRDEDRVAKLHSTLRPYIIRRQKGDVEKSLPKKTYNVLRVGMTSSQQDLYRSLLTKNYDKLGMKGKGKQITTLRNLVMELKKCCNHPYLFDNMEDLTVKTSVETLIRASGKMILLDKLLLRLRENGNRVLVFSQMVRMLDILSDYCRMRGFQYQRLDGSMHNDARVRAVDHYNAEGSTDFVFLLSTRAGGLGINLATADTVIIFDSDWNPQNDLQAESRAHRIGQKRDVKVFRLLSKMTVEEDILERAKRKRVLEHLVIHGVEGDEQDKDGKQKFNKNDLSAILRFGAEKLFKEEPARNMGDEVGEGSIANGRAPVGSGEDAKAEERRVLEADDIDELLARAPAEEDANLGGAEPSMGDSLLNAFKWADFDPLAEDEDGEEGAVDADRSSSAAREAAREISSLEEKRSRDIAAAQAKQEDENDALKEEGDAEYWDRVIPESMKKSRATSALDDKLVLGTRKRKKTKTYGTAESPDLGERVRSKRTARGSKEKDAAVYGSLSRREGRSMFRSWRKFGDVSRVADILRDASLVDRIAEADAQKLLEDALVRARRAVEDSALSRTQTEEAPQNDSRDDGGDTTANGKNGKSSSKPKGPPPVTVEVFGVQVNARELIRRCEEMELLGRRIRQTASGDTQFRLRKQIKPPSYGVVWKSKHDAMLLVGINRHGLGNWSAIASDKDLELEGKMNVQGSGPEASSAPDATKLMRRGTALLRELSMQEKSTTGVLKSGSTKSRKTKSRQAQANRGTKRDREVGSASASSKTRKRARMGKSDRTTMPSSRALSEKLKHSHLPTLKELRKISRDQEMSNGEKIRRTKECLLELGSEITKLAKSRSKAHGALWDYVHDVCKTAMAGERLAALYEKLVSGGSRRSGDTR